MLQPHPQKKVEEAENPIFNDETKSWVGHLFGDAPHV